MIAKKLSTIYVCSNCDSQFPKWLGRCPECGSWGTLNKQTLRKREKQRLDRQGLAAKVESFSQIKAGETKRLVTGINELDCVLGGGVVPGALILLVGDPGIGKSTLVLQMVARLGVPALYVSGEESGSQIKMRLDRLKLDASRLSFLGETEVETIMATIEENHPGFVVIDSIQTMSVADVKGEAGNVTQIKAATAKFAEVAKQNDIPILIIGHVTKGGLAAGPKTLEHLVDAVLSFEGDKYHAYRMLRALKNRFGATSEVGIFDMKENGLQEVKNPSAVFLMGRDPKNAGSAVTAVIEGSRAFLMEIQALLSKSGYGYAQRRSAGLSFTRLQLLLAVLSKRLKLPLGSQDVHVNVVGGFRVYEPAADLAICLAIVSAYYNKPLDASLVVIGEVGLAGEVRSVSQLEKRVAETEKLGFQKILLPYAGSASLKTKCELIKVRSVAEAVNVCFG